MSSLFTYDRRHCIYIVYIYVIIDAFNIIYLVHVDSKTFLSHQSIQRSSNLFTSKVVWVGFGFGILGSPHDRGYGYGWLRDCCYCIWGKCQHYKAPVQSPTSMALGDFNWIHPTSALTGKLKQTASKNNIKQTSKQANKQPNNPSFFLHQGEVKEEWTTAYEDMSCYYGYEGYGTGWDPWLGFQLVGWCMFVSIGPIGYSLEGFLYANL